MAKDYLIQTFEKSAGPSNVINKVLTSAPPKLRFLSVRILTVGAVGAVAPVFTLTSPDGTEFTVTSTTNVSAVGAGETIVINEANHVEFAGLIISPDWNYKLNITGIGSVADSTWSFEVPDVR